MPDIKLKESKNKTVKVIDKNIVNKQKIKEHWLSNKKVDNDNYEKKYNSGEEYATDKVYQTIGKLPRKTYRINQIGKSNFRKTQNNIYKIKENISKYKRKSKIKQRARNILKIRRNINKVTKRTIKVTTKTAKTTAGIGKRVGKALKATTKATVTAVKTTVKATITAIKAIILGTKALIAAIIAGRLDCNGISFSNLHCCSFM